MRVLLILNPGSATFKFEFFALADNGEATPRYRGLVDGVGRDSARLLIERISDNSVAEDRQIQPASHPDALAAVFAFAREHGYTLAAVTHRIVHGGPFFQRAVRIDADVIAKLETLTPLAPLHQPVGLAAIAAVSQADPDITQIACFDTAFHTTQDPLGARFAIAQRWHDAGVRRYSFHGLSYAAIAHRLPEVVGPELAEGRVAVLHLGSGSSACILHRRQSVANSTGMSAVEGLMMGTRPGNLDPEVVLWWMENAGMDIAAVRRELYKASGLLGVSGISADMRELLASSEPAAALAVELYCYRAAREIGALAVQAGGLDALVFTAGTGQRSAPVREKILARLAWLGFDLDPEANAANAARITRDGSRLSAWVIATDEEGQMAREAAALLAEG